MDRPDLEPGRLRGALEGLATLNRWSRGERPFLAPLRELARRTAPRPLRVLDLASGGGDVLLRLARGLRGEALELAGCDLNPRSVELANGRARTAGLALRFFELDALSGELPEDRDVLLCSLFLHHLDEQRAVLVSDLDRSRSGWALAWLGSRLLQGSDVVRTDALLSVEGAFTAGEARGLARRAGLDGARVTAHWPARYLLEWRCA
jgi:SAM-dependent methyltransferase